MIATTLIAVSSLRARVAGEEERIVFTNLTAKNGLSSGSVRGMLHDHLGSVWFATDAGLTRFDRIKLTAYQLGEAEGVDWKVDIQAFAFEGDGWFWLGTAGDGLVRYNPLSKMAVWFRADPKDPYGLSHNSVTALLREDRGPGEDPILWVGTENGLNRYDQKTAHFRREALGAPIDTETIRSMIMDTDGQLWVATASSGLFVRTANGEWNRAWNEPMEISAMTPDPEGGIWMATLGAGVYRFNAAARVVKQLEVEANVMSLLRDSQGYLWAGTSIGAGRYNPDSEAWIWYQHQSNDPGSIVPGPITAIFEDKAEVMWLGAATSGGVSRFSLTQSWFPGFSADLSDPTSLTHSSIHTFSESQSGELWLGTEGGVTLFDPETGKSERFRHDSSDHGSLPRNFATQVLEDSKGRLWVGTSGGGLARRDPGQIEFQKLRTTPPSIHDAPGETVTALYEDPYGEIWVGVRGVGVARWEESMQQFSRFVTDAPPSVLKNVTDLQSAGENGIWVSTASEGLWLLAPRNRLWTHYTSLTGGDKLTTENVTDIAPGQNGSIWIALKNGGFSHFNHKAGILKNFSPKEEHLPHSDAWAILEDREGHIWVATGAGLIRKDPNALGGYRRFDSTDGLQSSTFNAKSLYQASNGVIYAGGPNGFNVIDPSDLPKPLADPLPLLTTLKLYGAEVQPGPDSILERPLAALSKFDLPYDPGLSFSVSFGTLNYGISGQTRYRYRLTPYETGWRDANELQEASYTRLEPGVYTFEVQSSPDGSHWLEDRASIEIGIMPPWYETVWAMSSFAIAGTSFIVFLGVFLYRQRMAKERSRRDQLESERSRTEAALARQIQRALLLERTTVDFRRGLVSSVVFMSTVRRLAEHFRVARCFVLSCQPDDEYAQILAEYFEAPAESILLNQYPLAHPVMQRLMDLDATLSIERHNASSPEHVGALQLLGGDEVQSLLAVHTSHSGEANGVIVLHHLGPRRVWTDDEIKMLHSMSAQVGIALAQLHLREREAQQRVELEEARQVADAANQAKSDFLAKMTHEVRTPLNAILGFSTVMAQGGDLNESQRKHLEIINSSGEHLLGVINDILEVSKIEAGGAELNMERFNLDELIRSVMGMIHVKTEAKGIGLEFVALSDLPPCIEADKGKIRQILLNLMGNAVKFTETGGIALRAGVKEVDTESQNPEARPVRLEFEVFDTGAGIDENEIDKLFQKFVQTKSGKRATEGTGLGLSICKSFTELMNGEINVMSRVGFGTLFQVEIPCIEHRVAPVSYTTTQTGLNAGATVIGLMPGHQEVRVLVAEDQPLNRLLMQKLLSSAGFTLIEAEDGLQAVEKWRETRPHIIFMDEDMPNMRGTEATRAII
ncbi:MAG: two-component regulator propeller domain-containing protein, partial [Verrucomicrobiota bacterium]